MMKLTKYSLLFWGLVACHRKPAAYIHGYICNEEKKPLENIRIEDQYSSNSHIYSITNKDGYFRINGLTMGIYLYVIKDDKTIDTIQYVRRHSERGDTYLFVEGRQDTLFIDTKKLAAE